MVHFEAELPNLFELQNQFAKLRVNIRMIHLRTPSISSIDRKYF